MGGKTVTAASGTIAMKVAAGKSLTIKNGTVTSTNEHAIKAEGSGATITVGEGAKLTVSGNQNKCAIFVPIDVEDAVININGGEIISESEDAAAPVCVNGTLKKVTLNMTGGTITSKTTGIYFPANGDLTITGGKITGVDSAIEYRGEGTLAISGGEFTTTATTASQSVNKNGTTVVGAAVAVSPHDGRTCNVNITGGKFTASNTKCYAYWIGVVNGHTGAIGTVNISGETISGETYNSTADQ